MAYLRGAFSILVLIAFGLSFLVGCAAPAAPMSTRMAKAQPTAIATRTRPTDDAPMVYVPGGAFVMGSSDADIQAALADCRNCPDDWFDAEKPQHEVDLPSYWIDKYEITNRQFAKFIEAEGYDRREYWTEAGWEWKTRESRQRPAYWDQPAWNQPDLPVVGVVWFEAAAFCRWAGARLPSEAEWEKAASWAGDGGQTAGDKSAAVADGQQVPKLEYPWGNEWDPQRANTAEQGLRHTTPVGQFCREAAAASPYGVCDMAGNAWEWCSTLHRPLPYVADDGREDLEAKGTRTLRGGSWINERYEARAAYRLPPFPGDFILFDPTNGFRCAQND
jgi:formylglycine-generating enzyme required for sulfatase activity